MNSSLTCGRCLLSTEVPGVQIGADGTCSVCEKHDQEWGNWDAVKEQRLKELEKMFLSAKRKKRPYDVLVPVSGGKDSIYVMYLCRKVFKLKCLAVTWDNGLLSQHARNNIKKACDILEVDHTYYGINKNLLFRLYRFFFLKTGFLCPVCMRGIQVAISRTQLAFDIPLAVRGTSHRTEEYVGPDFFLPGTLDFLENTLEGNPLEKEAEPLLTPVSNFFSPPVVKIPDYLDWDYNEIFKVITNELGWTAKKEDEEHADCKIDNIINYIRYKKFPALVPEMLRYSKLVTAGIMTKEEAEQKISEHENLDDEPVNLSWFLDSLQITKEEFDQVLSEPMLHKKYLKPKSRVKRRLGALVNRYLP